MTDIIRFQVEVSSDELKELERLQKLGGLRTKKELLNNAVTLLKWAVRERARGCVVASLDQNTGSIKELTMPFLEHVQSSSTEKQGAKDEDGRELVTKSPK